MKTYGLLSAALLAVLLSTVWGLNLFSAEEEPADPRAKLQETFNAGNYKDAYEGYRKLALDADSDPRLVGQDLQMAINALNQLGRVDEIDAFREAVIEVHAKNWRLLHAAGVSYLEQMHYGFIIAGEFSRGHHRGGGEAVNSMERDRIRALQLLTQAMPLAEDEPQRAEVAELYLSLANALLGGRGSQESWRLQYLSDLSTLPDYDQGWYGSANAGGAPVDAEGNPIFYQVPKTFDQAENDGERWRWALTQAAEFAPNRLNEVRMQWANFLQNQFGVQTMAQYGWQPRSSESPDEDESGTYALHTLEENETIARLATGIKRFELPDEFNHIKVYQQIADDAKTGYGEQAIVALASIFENRRQYPKAAKYWQRVIDEHGKQDHYKSRLAQIVDNWGRFEPVVTQPAREGATVEYRFRNGEKVEFEAYEVKITELLRDIKDYLRSSPKQLDWQQMNIDNLGYRFVDQNEKKYLGKRVASWDLELKPKPNHFDDRVTVTTPLQKAGAYFVKAKMQDGNESAIVLWVADLAIIKKPLDGNTYYYVGDAVTGAPAAGAKLDFFGFQQVHENNAFRVETKEFQRTADKSGSATDEGRSNFQWIITAETNDGRRAYLGFTHIWGGQYHDQEYNATRVFPITDRPVYRPGQMVKYKFWIRHAKYDQENTSDFADQDFTLVVHDPKGEKFLTKKVHTDAYGGFDGELELPTGATLGVYQIFVENLGGGSFHVEEYKKPEFEVTVDAPTEPVMLGEKITATVKAKYYFGAPVVEAQVKYKVTRTAHDSHWYPYAPWDWLYGRGYWWFSYNYDWYPGWSRWGCVRPIPPWWGRSQAPPEIVAEQTVSIGPDGEIKIEIDTAVAEAIHPDEDHRYEVTAEVVDQSRRTIVGSGTVLVAREPFKVFSWLDRGYYRQGDVVDAHFQAQTLDQKPVKGEGKLTAYKVTYKDGKPVETVVKEWGLDTNDQGRADKKLKANGSGQYRLSYKVTDEKGHTIEGGYLFTIVGTQFTGANLRFNDLELIPNKAEYTPGESVNLQINTNRVDSTVLLFVRAANGVYLPPKVLHLDGKSTVDEIPVIKKDMPNFFIEAVTMAGGQVFTEVKEIVVPPEKRVLTVDVAPSQSTYRPGEEAKVKLRVTDFFGKPIVGSTVVAIYDKSVEYISGGSNLEETRAFFWKWRRHHHPNTESSLHRGSSNLARHEQWMQDLGAFGASVVEETLQLSDASEDKFEQNSARKRDRSSGMAGMGGGFAAAKSMRGAAAYDAAAAPAAAPMEAMAEGEVAAADADSPANLVEATVRSNFADTALWAGALETDENGEAEVAVKMPENLTTWKVRAWSLTHGTRVGEGTAEVITRKDLIVRMQAPRFFVQKDEVVLSANVHNYLKTAKQVQVTLDLEGKTLTALDETSRVIEVAAGGEERVDWRVRVAEEGEAVVTMKALTDEESDAVRMTFPAYVHGMSKMESFAGALRRDQNSGLVTYRIPDERRPEQSRVEVRYSPTLAGAMVDALPYLVEYPYGCTEQTLNRFVPTVITQKILLDMKLNLAEIAEKRTNLNAQEIGDDRKRAEGWKRYDREPVFDEQEVRKMAAAGVDQLAKMQVSDGGWGWFSGWGERSYPHTTAVVVHGLQLAQANDVALPPGMLDRGVAWLQKYQQEEIQKLKNAEVKPDPVHPFKTSADDIDALVFMVLVDADHDSPEMRDYLYRDRTKLSVYAKALFGLGLHKTQQQEQLTMILENIEQFVVQDDENQTAYLKLPNEGYWWYWYGSEVEAHAFYLKLLAKTDPQGTLASRIVKYLLNNRKHATYWNSTRDTAYAIEALAEYLRASGENEPNLTVEVWLDGEKRKEVEITKENLFTFDNKFVLTGDEVTAGEHKLELRKRGESPLYYNTYVTNFTLEDDIKRAGLEVKVNRKFYKLIPVDKEVKVSGSRGQAVDQKVEKYEREEIENLDAVTSGDLVEVELEIDSKNDYEYLVFEDMKAAGFEAVELRSGYNSNSLGAYMELRDNRVSFFVRWLARGKHSIKYRLRAEIPGKFSALPAHTYAMYAPELKGNSDEIKVEIVDREIVSEE